MQIPKLVQSCYLWRSPEYQYQPVKLFGIILYYRNPERYPNTDSLPYLFDLGFKIGKCLHDSRFYEVELPKGWSVTEKSYSTEYYDQTGLKRISQFDKFCSYDSVHFINILK